MRLIFVTPRFQAGDATPSELLAVELARRAPDGWRTTVLTTTEAGGAEAAFRDGEVQEEGARVVRFPAEASAPPGSDRAADPAGLASPALLDYLRERLNDCDLVVLFGSSALCREAAKLVPERTVLLPFADEAPVDPEDSEIYRYPAAFVFGSEAEEVLVLKRHQVHRRMRETITGNLLLPRTADKAAFRSRTKLSGDYLIGGGPLEPGRGVEELLRFFCTFKDRHPDAALELVLVGPAAMRIPQRPDVRVVQPNASGERLDAVAGALLAVIPERLAAFSTTAAEPFSVGVPILVNASANELASECRASGGGLYYQNYDEFELILELGLRDPTLFRRMGAAGRGFLESRHDWDRVLARYDRAFRSFARPSRTGPAEPAPSGPAEAEEPAEPAAAPPAAAPQPADEPAEDGQAPPGEETEGEPAPVTPGMEETPEAAEAGSPEPAAPSGEEGPAAVPEETSESEAVTDPATDAEDAPAPDEEEAISAPEEASEEDETETDDEGLPSFFRGSIRD